MLTKDEAEKLLREAGAEEAVAGLFYVTAKDIAAVIAAHTAKVLENVEPVAWQVFNRDKVAVSIEETEALAERFCDYYSRDSDSGPHTYAPLYPAHTVAVLKSERDALAARVAELAAALLKCRDMVEHPDNVAFIDAALAAKGQA